MQHGTGREYVRDIIEDTLAVLERYAEVWRTGDLRANLSQALKVLDGQFNLDAPGVYGPDYGQAQGVTGASDTTVGSVVEPDDWSDTVLGHAYDEVDEDLSYWDMADERPFAILHPEQVDDLRRDDDEDEEHDYDPYDWDDGRWDDDPNPYEGTYSEE